MPHKHSQTPLHALRPQRIALIKPSALGDIIHSLPVLSALRGHYPAAHITWIVNHAYEPLLKHHPDLDATLPYDRDALRQGLPHAVCSSLSFAWKMRQQEFDLVIDLQGLLRTGLMCLASGAQRKIGLATAREGSRHCYTDVIGSSDDRNRHAVDRYWDVIKALGAASEPFRFDVPVLTDAREWARKQLADWPRPWLVLGVGARWETKRWLPEHFGILADRMQTRFGGTVIFIGREDETIAAEMTAKYLCGPMLDLTGRSTLPQLVGLLSMADVMLANDSGPSHVADALGKPVISPYTCTKVSRHGPFHNRERCAEANVPCQGSYLRKCTRMDCMKELTPEVLWPGLEEVLLQWQENYQLV